jgi:hypothetical protein
MDVEDLEVYKKLCGLPIHVCDLTHQWPQEENYELVSIHKRHLSAPGAVLARFQSSK